MEDKRQQDAFGKKKAFADMVGRFGLAQAILSGPTESTGFA
jgi:hypothetical protein